MVCTSMGSLLHPLFYFLCSNLEANPVLLTTNCHIKQFVAIPIVTIIEKDCSDGVHGGDFGFTGMALLIPRLITEN